MTTEPTEDYQKHFSTPVIAAGKDDDGCIIYKDAKTGERRWFSNCKEKIVIKDSKGNNALDPEGNVIYKDKITGQTYIVSAEKRWREEALAKQKQKEEERKQIEEKKRLKESQSMKAKEEQKFMADENITKFDVLKEKVETLKEETKNKLLEREKFDKELEEKVKTLDKKTCEGEECYNRIEKNQQETWKTLEERLKRLEEPVYVCSNCNIGTLRRGATECPYCGIKVKGWN